MEALNFFLFDRNNEINYLRTKIYVNFIYIRTSVTSIKVLNILGERRVSGESEEGQGSVEVCLGVAGGGKRCCPVRPTGAMLHRLGGSGFRWTSPPF